MMTNGHKPFEELSAGYEIDKFIVEVLILQFSSLTATCVCIYGTDQTEEILKT